MIQLLSTPKSGIRELEEFKTREFSAYELRFLNTTGMLCWFTMASSWNTIYQELKKVKAYPANTHRPEDVPLWSYFGLDVLDHNRTKIGRIKFSAYFGSPMSGMHLASGKVEKFY